MSQTQARPAFGLLRKLPDLNSISLTGDPQNPVLKVIITGVRRAGDLMPGANPSQSM
jgi:hypothetical protein